MPALHFKTSRLSKIEGIKDIAVAIDVELLPPLLFMSAAIARYLRAV